MKVLEVKSRRVIEVSENYGARLIEHGMAILPPRASAPEPANGEEPVAAPKPAKVVKGPRKGR